MSIFLLHRYGNNIIMSLLEPKNPCLSVCLSQGLLLAKDIRDRERGGRAEVRSVEGDAEKQSPQEMEILNSFLGERNIKLTDGPPDETFDQEQMGKLSLYW